ncbi:helix-turn-helix domain-containing protein [Klebsiella variicola subsp. variicola]|nr:helix-turn-helix domain-containing protein [Klebsiella variicola subsp. variicola]
MNYIRRQLVDPDLNIESLARAHHVSVRTVTRAFARHKKTPMAVIWQERLQASREAIERGRVSSVSQAALDFGFSDFSLISAMPSAKPSAFLLALCCRRSSKLA